MSAESQYEREENAIHAAYERGELTHQELMGELRDLTRDYQSQARESAERAYEDELQRW